MNTQLYNLIVVLGPTATGKTSFAAHLSSFIDGEIISADSRQVYRRMTIGTGKDYDDYKVDDNYIPAHLLDIHEPGYHYNVYEFQNDFFRVFEEIQSRNKMPVLCGGSGLYIEAVLQKYKMIHVPPDPELRKTLENKSLEELEEILETFKNLHNTTDTKNKRRAVRAIELETYYKNNPEIVVELPSVKPLVIGLQIDREDRRSRITKRLNDRLEEGMIEEVRSLLDEGLSPDTLIYYGLEYKYLTKHVIGELSYDEMLEQLNIAIHQFAKRQMTWFRGMERRGTKIHWLNVSISLEERIQMVKELMKN